MGSSPSSSPVPSPNDGAGLGTYILGIDPGGTTGVVLIRVFPDSTWDLTFRASVSGNVADLYHWIETTCEMYPHVTAICMERVFPASMESAIDVAEKMGVTRLVALDRRLELREYHPSTVRKVIAGHGHATDQLVRSTMRGLFGIRKNPGKGQGFSSHEADAGAAALCAVLDLWPDVRLESRRTAE